MIQTYHLEPKILQLPLELQTRLANERLYRLCLLSTLACPASTHL